MGGHHNSAPASEGLTLGLLEGDLGPLYRVEEASLDWLEGQEEPHNQPTALVVGSVVWHIIVAMIGGRNVNDTLMLTQQLNIHTSDCNLTLVNSAEAAQEEEVRDCAPEETHRMQREEVVPDGQEGGRCKLVEVAPDDGLEEHCKQRAAVLPSVEVHHNSAQA